MGIIDNALGRWGYKRQTNNSIEAKASDGGSYSGALGGNNPTIFSSFNNKRQQLNSYEDWVYIAARTIAEQCAAIDLRCYLNRTQMKSVMLGNKLHEAPRVAAKYLQQRKNIIEFDQKKKEFVLRKDVPALEELETHPLLELLNSPNPFMTKNEFFEITFLHLELTGNAFWAIMERDAKGNPSELFPLMPSQMTIVPDAKDFIAGYMYRVNGKDIPFSVDDIIHHKYANPADMREGYSAVEAGSRAIDTDQHMAEWNRKTMYNDARISGFLTTDTPLDDKTFKRVKEEFNNNYSGTANAYKIALLEGGMDFKQMSLTPKDMDFQSAREFNRDQILAMFGVPKSLVGYDNSMSRANAETAEYVFTKGRIKPKMQRLVNRITEDLAPQFDKRVIISFTDPVPEDKEFLLKETQAALGLGGTVPWATINEERAKRGDDLIEDGDEMLVPSTFTPLSQLLAEPEETPTAEAPLDTNPDDGIDEGADNDMDGDGEADDAEDDNPSDGGSTPPTDSSGDTSGSSTSAETNDGGNAKNFVVPKFSKPIAAAREAAKAERLKAKAALDINATPADETPALSDSRSQLQQYINVRHRIAMRFELAFARAARQHFNEQKQEVLAALHMGFGGKQYSELSGRELKIGLGSLFDRANSERAWTAALLPLYMETGNAATQAANDLLRALGKLSGSKLVHATVMKDAAGDSVAEYFSNRASTISKGIDAETDKQLRATLTEGVNAGEGRQPLMDRVEAVYGAAAGYRADRIARTESQAAMNYAAYKAWEATGFITSYIWIANTDACSYCSPYDGQKAAKADEFKIGMPPAHPNCRCTIAPYQFNDGTVIPGLSDEVGAAEGALGAIVAGDLTEDVNFLKDMTKQAFEEMWYSDKWGDQLLAYLYGIQGYDAKPELLAEKEFAAYAAKSELGTLYRGIAGNPEYTENFKTGSYYAGNGIYGNGTYASNVRATAENYANQDNTPGIITNLTLKPDAKLISLSDLHTIQKDYMSDIRSQLKAAYDDPTADAATITRLNQLAVMAGDEGRFAVMKGYDAIVVHGAGTHTGENFYVLLNRGAMVIQQ